MKKDIKVFSIIALILHTLYVLMVYVRVRNINNLENSTSTFVSEYLGESLFLALFIMPLLITFLIKTILFSKEIYHWHLNLKLTLIYVLFFAIGLVMIIMEALSFATGV